MGKPDVVLAMPAQYDVPASGAFEPNEFLGLCEHHPGCSAFLAPTMVQRLVATGRPRPRNLKTVVYGGGPMYVDSLKKAMAAFGPIFVQLYGQGEAPMTITGLRRADHIDADDEALGSVGYARSGVDVAVLATDGTPAAVGEIGEIVCRGDVVMSGYWKNPDATAAALKDGNMREVRPTIVAEPRAGGVLVATRWAAHGPSRARRHWGREGSDAPCGSTSWAPRATSSRCRG